MKERSEKTLSILIFVLAIGFIAYGVFIYYPQPENRTSWGQFGDAFGVFNGLAFLIAMYALYLQKKENNKAEEARQRKEYPVIIQRINDFTFSPEVMKAKYYIYEIFSKHKLDFPKFVEQSFTNYLNEYSSQTKSKHFNEMNQLISFSMKLFAFYKSLFIFEKEKIIKKELILDLLPAEDFQIVTYLLAPIILTKSSREVDVISFYEVLQQEFIRQYS